MSGVTDLAFRRTVLEASGTGSIGLLTTEFLSVELLTAGHPRTRSRMDFDASIERPLSVQLFGDCPQTMAEAARIVAAAGAQMVDINGGCPAPKVVKRGGGAELMRDPVRFAKIIEATVKAVPIPVTVKMRSGWNDSQKNVLEVARLAEQAGAQMISVHGRTRAQLYSGAPDWDVVDAVAQTVSVPVIGSGDLVTAEQTLERLKRTHAAGVMIGRAAIMNPWIFGQLDDLIAGNAPRIPGSQARIALVEAFAIRLSERLPERAVAGRLKQLLARLSKGVPGGGLFRTIALRAVTHEALLGHVRTFFEAAEAGEAERWAVQARQQLSAAKRPR
ncbi:MAG: tRNA-dihydrouridine synthase [Myxococcales bacterium]|nr:tRNA-dihydrouridine synthase [Myxococcales bacterium]